MNFACRSSPCIRCLVKVVKRLTDEYASQTSLLETSNVLVYVFSQRSSHSRQWAALCIKK